MKSARSVRRWFLCPLLGAMPCTHAHHSGTEYFDQGTELAFDAEVVDVQWRNPHVTLTVATSVEDGSRELWTLEGPSVLVLTRFGVSRDSLEVGSQVHVEGVSSTRRERRMWFSSISAGAEELIGTAYIRREVPASALAESAGSAEGIFRVWTWVPGAAQVRWSRPLPLTEAAQAAQAIYDPTVDDEVLQCVPPGMPRAMSHNPFPIEFVDDGDAIRLRLEEFNTVRTIHMDSRPPSDLVAATPLGYSYGRWEGESLVVQTTRIDYPLFDREGVPQSADVEIVERFTLNGDESELAYEITVTDPQTFLEPVVGRKMWRWDPSFSLQEYNCGVDEPASR